MAKKRKTKEQKRLADLRHEFTHSYAFNPSPSVSQKPQLNIKTEAKTITINQNLYPFLKKDLSKTALLTMGILIFQAILFLSFKNHFISIPGLNY
jgi:hypothetical protein